MEKMKNKVILIIGLISLLLLTGCIHYSKIVDYEYCEKYKPMGVN